MYSHFNRRFKTITGSCYSNELHIRRVAILLGARVIITSLPSATLQNTVQSFVLYCVYSVKKEVKYVCRLVKKTCFVEFV